MTSASIVMTSDIKDNQTKGLIRVWMGFASDKNKNINAIVFGINQDLSLMYSIDEVNKIITIELTNRDLNVKYNDPNNLLCFVINTDKFRQHKDFQFIVTIMGISHIKLFTYLPSYKLTTDAEVYTEILSTVTSQRKNSFVLNAPNLKELTIDTEAFKIMVLSDQTPKDFKLTTKENMRIDYAIFGFIILLIIITIIGVVIRLIIN